MLRVACDTLARRDRFGIDGTSASSNAQDRLPRDARDSRACCNPSGTTSAWSGVAWRGVAWRGVSECWYLTDQCIGSTLEHVLGDCRLHLLVDHQNDDTARIQATTSSSTAHLNVLARVQPSKVLAVELAHARKDHGLGGHVEAHGEGLGRKERLDQALLEQDLDHLLEDRQQARVMDSDTTFQQRQNGFDLRV